MATPRSVNHGVQGCRIIVAPLRSQNSVGERVALRPHEVRVWSPAGMPWLAKGEGLALLAALAEAPPDGVEKVAQDLAEWSAGCDFSPAEASEGDG